MNTVLNKNHNLEPALDGSNGRTAAWIWPIGCWNIEGSSFGDAFEDQNTRSERRPTTMYIWNDGLLGAVIIII